MIFASLSIRDDEPPAGKERERRRCLVRVGRASLGQRGRVSCFVGEGDREVMAGSIREGGREGGGDRKEPRDGEGREGDGDEREDLATGATKLGSKSCGVRTLNSVAQQDLSRTARSTGIAASAAAATDANMPPTSRASLVDLHSRSTTQVRPEAVRSQCSSSSLRAAARSCLTRRTRSSALTSLGGRGRRSEFIMDESRESGSPFSELLNAVQEELDHIENEDLLGKDAYAEALRQKREREAKLWDPNDHRSERERKLDQYLEKNFFSHSFIENTVERLEETSEALLQHHLAPSSADADEEPDLDEERPPPRCCRAV